MILRLIVALVCAVFFAASARAEDAAPLRGVALIIGNGDYQHLPRLANPENDAKAIEDLMSGLGFDTDVSTDRDAKRLRRDLERFEEDAEGADVAFIHYSGHGIEAGGENYLVPVDADIAALDEAGERLVPLSALITRLQAKVPLVIVTLDACRNNPFPPDAVLTVQAGGAPVPVAAAGLSPGQARGAAPLSDKPAVDSVGTIIGFAAQPGKAALDGPAGAGSPYATALVRHISAMAGVEFGTVMRMVTEEVYLKTAGRQRPWVNESLRRQLYFGESPAPPEGAEGEILVERRQLLLTIAALPDVARRQVEVAAADGGVPMDALYGMLNVLGAAAPHDPEQLEAVLRAQTARSRRSLPPTRRLPTAIRRLPVSRRSPTRPWPKAPWRRRCPSTNR